MTIRKRGYITIEWSVCVFLAVYISSFYFPFSGVVWQLRTRYIQLYQIKPNLRRTYCMVRTTWKMGIQGPLFGNVYMTTATIARLLRPQRHTHHTARALTPTRHTHMPRTARIRAPHSAHYTCHVRSHNAILSLPRARPHTHARTPRPQSSFFRFLTVVESF